MFITKNLRHLLDQISLDSTITYIWVDAVCINQDDDQEKSWQVQQMSKIYEQAAFVLCWLGPEESSGELFKMLEMLADFKQASGSALDASRYLLAPDPHNGLSQDCRLFLEDIITFRWRYQDTFRRFVVNPYWYRTWVIQEFALARTVHFYWGSSRIRAKEMTTGMRVIALFSGHAMIDLDKLNIRMKDHHDLASCLNFLERQRSYSSENRVYLFDILIETSGASPSSPGKHLVSDKRDHIYGLLGLAADAEEIGVLPDYTKNYREVYIEAARLLINAGYPVLTFAGFTGLWDEFDTLPTWVPNWATNRADRIFFSVGSLLPPRQPLVHAGTGIQHKEWVCRNHSEDEPLSTSLSILGASLGSVRGQLIPPATLQTYLGYKRLQTIFPDIMVWFIAALNFVWSATLQSNDTELKETACRILRGDLCVTLDWILDELLPHDRPAGFDWPQLCTTVYTATVSPSLEKVPIDQLPEKLTDEVILLLGLNRTMISGSKIYTDSLSRAAAKLVLLILLSVVDLSKDRSLICTSKGYVGIAPRMVHKGDVVAILANHPAPMILRPQDSGDFQLIGDAYIDGVMYGELDFKEHDLEIFTLV